MGLDLSNAIRKRKQKMLEMMIDSIIGLTADTNKSVIHACHSELESLWSEFSIAFEDYESILASISDDSLFEATDEFIGMYNSYTDAKIHAALLMSNSTKSREINEPQTSSDIGKPTAISAAPISSEPIDFIEHKVSCNTSHDILLHLNADQTSLKPIQFDDSIESFALYATPNEIGRSSNNTSQFTYVNANADYMIVNPSERTNVVIDKHQVKRPSFDKILQWEKPCNEILEEYLTANSTQSFPDRLQFQSFLPHFEMIDESNTITKVTFASAPFTQTRISKLSNETTNIGSMVKPDHFHTLISWLKFTESSVMHRMSCDNPKQADLQLIRWHRPGTNSTLPYELLILKFGMHEIGHRITETHPELANICQSTCYVTDVMRQFPTTDCTRFTNIAISKRLAKNGLTLRKWKSINVNVLDDISEVDCERRTNFDSTFIMLGIAWHAPTDMFTLKSVKTRLVKGWPNHQILSHSEKLFDSFGRQASCNVRAKGHMLDIWRPTNNVKRNADLPSPVIAQCQAVYLDVTISNIIRTLHWPNTITKTLLVDANHQGNLKSIRQIKDRVSGNFDEFYNQHTSLE